MSHESLEQFRDLVLRDLLLQQQLRETPSRESFLALMVQLGNERAYRFSVEDVEAALRASRRVWLERYI